MNKFKKTLIFLSFVLIFYGCNKPSTKEKPSGLKPQPLPVSVMEVKSFDVPISAKYPAKIVSEQSVDIVAKVNGTIIKQFFKAGDNVKKGDKLFLIDDEKYRSAVDVAKANLGVANASYKMAELDYDRVKKLKQSNSISQKEFDLALLNLKISKAKVDNAKAILRNAQIDLGYTIVTAPFDGILGDPYKDIGAYVSIQNPNLVRLTKLNPIYAKYAISDIDALNINSKILGGEWVQKDSPATLTINEKEYNGTTVFIDRVINPLTNSVDAKAVFDNQNLELIPGSFAVVTMSGLYQKNGFKIPQIAIKQDLKGAFVYLVKDGKVAKSSIKISDQTSQYAVVSHGLEDGDKIILDNFIKLRLGMPVKIVEGK
ncbi:efflux RND transporter periplasmic adaptor subunit [Campylobacter sp. FMV-PI01]|uniref:Efflux RND transporter periplasmic adaptor subunit n=1 Tax=Campylobacter portucalensis TaxID=2608384 RepID=A0A6L5WFE1_9BACT|nr:efflux RND transporter periplasmic adaptor subunit [Campylobacter portucalensis]MSN95730.1 efflux RND transporter periplasmic adaptor subunit [Campylobacter portucalensis]